MGVIRGLDPMPPRTEPYEVVRDDIVETADVCIIGSGAGGAVVARSLVAAGRTVVLLERGGYYEGRDMNQRDMDMVPLLWKNGGFNFDDRLSIAIAQASCVGGSTVINDAVCFDPPPRVVAEWKSMGVDFSDTEWAEHTKRVRDAIHVQKVTEEELNRNNRMLRQGAVELHLRDHWPNERNCVNCMQCGFCHNGCHYNTKQNMLVTFLHEALHDPAGELRIYCNCEAGSIRNEAGRIDGVEGSFLDLDGEEQYRIRVNARVVVVSAGAIASSHFLLRNRIASRTAGRGVVLHPSVLMVGLFPYEIKPNQGIPMAYAIHDFGVNRRQDLTRKEWGAEGGEFMIESISLPMMEFAMGMPGGPLKHHQFLGNFNSLAIAGMLTRDQTRGRVALADGGGLSFTYEIDLADRLALAKASEVTAKMWFALGATKLATRHPAVPFIDRPDEIPLLTQAFVEQPDRMKLASAHPQSGNAIGADPESSVVDSSLRVHGLSNLYVADASVFPNAVGVNPQLTVMVVASIGASRMVRDWAGRHAGATVSSSTGRTGSLAHPMYFHRAALAAAFAAAQHHGPVAALATPTELHPTAATWSIDPTTLEITNATRWRGFFGRDQKLPPDSSVFRTGFFRTYASVADGMRGVTHTAPTDLAAEHRVREGTVEGFGAGILAEYTDPSRANYAELLKVVDDRLVLGRIFEGKPGSGGGFIDFALARRYPFEYMTTDDHEMIFQRSPVPKPAEALGGWEGRLVGDATWSAPVIEYRIRPEGAGLINDVRFVGGPSASVEIRSDGTQFGVRSGPGGYSDDLRRVNDEWMVGKVRANPDQLKTWVPAKSEWSEAPNGSDLRVVLRRVADLEALKEPPKPAASTGPPPT